MFYYKTFQKISQKISRISFNPDNLYGLNITALSKNKNMFVV